MNNRSRSRIATKLMWVCVAALIFAPLFAADDAQPAPTPQAAPKTRLSEVRLMTIGNSFADNVLTYLPQIAAAAGKKLIVGRANIGGSGFKTHWDAWSKNVKDTATGRPYNKNKDSLGDMLLKEKWDYITIQQDSLESYKYETFMPYAKNLFELIKSKCPGAEVLVHKTWAYRDDWSGFSATLNQKSMFLGLTDAYNRLCTELGGLRQIPAGDAIQNLRETPEWTFKPDANFNPLTANPKTTPEQKGSLNMGWAYKGTKFVLDYKHLNTPGKYEVACVWYEFIFGESVIGNSFVPQGLSKENLAFLQQVAHKTVSEGLRPALK